jgi:hypothetical protein
MEKEQKPLKSHCKVCGKEQPLLTQAGRIRSVCSLKCRNDGQRKHLGRMMKTKGVNKR